MSQALVDAADEARIADRFLSDEEEMNLRAYQGRLRGADSGQLTEQMQRVREAPCETQARSRRSWCGAESQNEEAG